MDEASVHATSLQLYIQSSEFNVTHYFVSMFLVSYSAFLMFNFLSLGNDIFITIKVYECYFLKISRVCHAIKLSCG